MPGRQSTRPAPHRWPKPKDRAQKRTLNALAIAEQQNPDTPKIRKARLGESGKAEDKRRREDSDDSQEVGRNQAPKVKRLRAGDKDRHGNEIEGGSDSEGNEWVTGIVDSDDDSSLDSDEAMSGSDIDRFGDFTFGGSSSKNSKKDAKDDFEPGDGENHLFDPGEESEDFAAEAVGLAAALDEEDTQFTEGSDLLAGQASSSDRDGSELSISEDEYEANDAVQFSALRDLVASMNREDAMSRPSRDQFEDVQEAAVPSEYTLNPRQKLTAATLNETVTDAKLRKSLRLVTDYGGKTSAASKGIPGKLEVPLAKRQQDRLDRAAAYEKSKETLDRWVATVKHNRRAEHLIFPFPKQNSKMAKETRHLPLITQSRPATDLESTIQTILVESGLATSDGKSAEDQIQAFEGLAASKMPVEDIQARRAELRRVRELLFREEIKAKRIKKIKSKSYRRVHRKERARNALHDREALVAIRGDLSEDEQEHLDRVRAEERMGARHRESKWAKGVKATRRATWDENARSGVTEMARRNEELRKRIQGKTVHGQGSVTSGSDSGDDGLSDKDDDDVLTTRMRDKLSRLTDNHAQGTISGLSSLKFMQKADAARMAENNKAIESIRRELANEASSSDESEVTGRQRYGPDRSQAAHKGHPFKLPSEFEERVESEGDGSQGTGNNIQLRKHKPRDQDDTTSLEPKSKMKSSQDPTLHRQKPKSLENPWLSIPKKSYRSEDESRKTVLISTAPEDIQPTLKPTSNHITIKTSSPRASLSSSHKSGSGSESASFAGFSPPPSSSSIPKDNATLIRQAFASDDVLAAETFASEKAALVASEEPVKTSSNKLPGWGSWVGVGLSKKDKRGPVVSNHTSNMKGEIHAEKDVISETRKDRTLDKVIVSEKRIPKSAKYLASGLPHPFETKAQYERSLRLPIGQEWTTKETFQGMTKPRVIVKGGIIKPIRKPLM